MESERHDQSTPFRTFSGAFKRMIPRLPGLVDGELSISFEAFSHVPRSHYLGVNDERQFQRAPQEPADSPQQV